MVEVAGVDLHRKVADGVHLVVVDPVSFSQNFFKSLCEDSISTWFFAVF